MITRATARQLALAAAPLAFVLAWAVWPLARLVLEGADSVRAGGWALWWAPWLDAYWRARLLWSLAQAAITAAAAVVVGVPIAWVLSRFAFAGRSLLVRALMLPFVVPTLVAALGVLALWGPQGLVPLPGHDSPLLLLVGNLFFNACLVVRGAMGGLAQVSASRLAAARSLGATPWRAFWRLEWPAARANVAASACLVFLYCLSGFGLALILGGQRWATVEVEIYTLVAYELALGQASVLALWMLLMAALVVLLYAGLATRRGELLRGDAIALRPVSSLPAALAVLGAVVLLVVFNFGPVLALVWRALTASPAAWAHAWGDDAWLALGNSLRFTAMGLVLAAVLGVLQGLAAPRSWAWRAWGMVPLLVSPVMVAFGLLLLWPQQLDQLWVLVSAYALLALPLVSAPVAQALQALPASWLAAARSLGASPWRVAWRVTLPLLRGALRRGLAFAAATMLGEFAVTLLLSRPEWLTLSTYTYQLLGRPGQLNLEAAWIMAATLMGVALLAFAVLDRPEGVRRA